MMRRRYLQALGGAILVAGGLPLYAGFRGPYRSPEPLPSGPIIDMHVHVAGIGAGGSGCYVSPSLRRNWRYRIYLNAFGTSQADLTRYGDRHAMTLLAKGVERSRYVDAAVVLALDGVVEWGELNLSRTEVYIPNDFVLQETRAYPNLIPAASVNPYRSDALDRLEGVTEAGAVLLKWLPNIQGIRPDDPAIRPFYRRMAELGLPLLTHVGSENSFSRADNSLGEVSRLHLPLEEGVRVVAAHAGYSGFYGGASNVQLLAPMMKRYPNLFADISSLTQINKRFALSEVLKAGVDDRLLFGTDMPLINTGLVAPWHYPFELTWEQIRQIRSYESPWDRDLQLKRLLGVPAQVFSRPAQFLNVDI